MFRTALRELRHHPGRFLAVLIAVAISVGFLAASSVVTATEAQATAKQLGGPYTNADLAVHVADYTAPDGSSLSTGIDSSLIPTNAQLLAVVQQALPQATVWSLESSYQAVQNGPDFDWMRVFAVPPAAFDWTTVGHPAQPLSAIQLSDNEILVDAATASKLGITTGMTVDFAQGTKMVVAGITNEPGSLYVYEGHAYVNQTVFAKYAGASWSSFADTLVDVTPGTDVSQAAQTLADAMTAAGFAADVSTGALAASQAGLGATQGVDIFKYFAWVFGAIALVVGMITVVNTFTILLAQRRRNLGLLRAVGASGAQVRHSIWAEALVLGLLGSAIGIGLAYGLAAIVGSYTESIHFGLAVPWLELSAELAIGLIVTMLASALPAYRSTRIPVLEALRPAQADVRQLRVPPVRSVICGLLFVGGVVICVLSMRAASGTSTLLMAIAGAALVSLGVLFGAPLFIPGLLRLIGAPLGRAGVTPGIAVKNITRDPRRSSTTATALMLAVGLIVTLQVGASTMQSSIEGKLDTEYPIGLWVGSDTSGAEAQSIPEGMRQQLAGADGISGSVTLDCRMTLMITDTMRNTAAKVCSYDPTIARIATGQPASIPDDTLLVSPDPYSGAADGDTVSIAGWWLDDQSGPSVSLTAEATKLIENWAYYYLVSPATFAKLDGAGSPVRQSVMLFAVSNATDAAEAVTTIVGSNSSGPTRSLSVGGSAIQRQEIEQGLGLVVNIVTALLAVAVLIALVGVSNTLTLSVIERTRESALLRALGLRRGQLRLTLLIEALMLTVVSTVVGVVFGVLLGYVGVSALVRQMFKDSGIDMTVRLSINWWQTLGLLAVLVLAAVLASLLPARRAALAAPTEALEDV